jgi:hypothetical protein
VGELVVSTTDLEGEDILEILALEVDVVLGTGGKVDGVGEGGLFEDLIAAGGEDQTEVIRVLMEVVPVVLGGVD